MDQKQLYTNILIEYAYLQKTGGRTTEHRGDLEWSFKVTLGCFPEYMNSNDFCIIQVLQAHEGLDKKGLSIFHVDMEEGHHGDTEVRAAELEHVINAEEASSKRYTYEFRSLGKIIVPYGGRDKSTRVGRLKAGERENGSGELSETDHRAGTVN